MRWWIKMAALLPLGCLLHLVGFAFAHLTAPGHAQRNPLSLGFFDERPLPQAYAAALGDVFSGLSTTLPDGSLLATRLATSLPASLALWLPALLLSVSLGTAIGVAGVDARNLRLRRWLPVLSGIGLATPSFYFGALALSGVLIFLIVAPGRPLLFPLGGYGLDAHLVLPLIALSLRPTAAIAGLVGGLLLEELGRAHIMTARAYGVPEPRIERRHALRNVLPAVVSAAATDARRLVGELILIEVLFTWPGIGALLAATLIPANASVGAEAALFLHAPTLALTLALLGVAFAAISLCADWLLARLDPRMRHV